jgi:hypothetical protein
VIFGRNKDIETQEQAIAEQRELALKYKRTFGNADGRDVLFDLCNAFHILNSHKGDAFAEGQRSVVLRILQKCNINMVEFDRILKGETE